MQGIDDEGADDFPVLAENWDALLLFLDCSNQWRYAPMGGVVGLDAQGVSAVMDMRCIEPQKRAGLYAQLRLIESGALKRINGQKSHG